jgi:pimeloyl-ACP methyl ester carboxylesterase
MAQATEVQKAAENTSVRPFEFNFPEEELTDLRRRIEATRWPEKETVTDDSQGVQLTTMEKLARYWATDYDWRKCEARLKSFPNFTTEIDGLDIHFIHVRSKHENALPVCIVHGWPGSIVEQMKLIEPLTDPTAYGGTAEEAFDVVIPSIPGYGFSGKPTEPGWNPVKVAKAFNTLMTRLGYTKFVAQGGDWGAVIVDMMGLEAPPELLAITPTWPVPFQTTLTRRPLAGNRLRRISQRMRKSLTTVCSSSIKKGSATASRWDFDRRRCMGSRILRSASRPTSSIMTSAATG